VRSVGLPGALSEALRVNMMPRRRDFTLSNSEVVTMYSDRAGRMRAISFWAASMRSGVGGCVEKNLGDGARAALLIGLDALEEG